MSEPASSDPNRAVPAATGPTSLAEVRFVATSETQERYADLVLAECRDLLRRRFEWNGHLKQRSLTPEHSDAGESWFRLLPAGLEYACDTWVAFYFWSHFERIILHNGQIIFALDGWTSGSFKAYGVPTSAFSSPERALVFFETARTAHNASGHGERMRIQEATSRFAVACPNCRYSLASLGEPRCPECGQKVSIAMLRLALMLHPQRP